MTILGTQPFLDDGRTAVNGLRRAVADILVSVGADPDQPQEISRRFGLDKTLTWRISRVVREEDTWEAVQHIPRRPSIMLLVAALSKHGAPASRVQALLAAVDDFERFIEIHSGDRETLEIMTSLAAQRPSSKRLEAIRKDGHNAAVAMWGVRARLQLASQFMAPGTKPGLTSHVTVSGLADFRRVRANTSWAMTSIRAWDGTSHNSSTSYLDRLRPLSHAGKTPDDLVLREFCSDINPQFRIIENPTGTFRYMLAEGAVGNTAAASIFLGWHAPNVAGLHESFPGEPGDHVALLSTPVEELVHDLFLHKDMEFAMDVSARVYSQLPGGPQYPHTEEHAQTLPVPTDLHNMGIGAQATIAELPNYGEIIARAAGELGLRPEDFRLFRYRLSYPPIPAMSVLRHSLLPAV